MRPTPDINQAVYQQNAQRWHKQRAADLGERAWLDQLALPSNRGSWIWAVAAASRWRITSWPGRHISGR